MNEHLILQPFSESWLLWNSITLFFVCFILWLGKKSNLKIRSKILKYLAFLVAFESIAIQLYYIYQGVWTPQDSLPLHLCRLMWFTSFVLLMTKNQIAFELLLFVGMIGGFHSLLTPEFTHGIDLVLTIDYFFVHGGLIAIPMYCLVVLGMRPRRLSWIKACLYLQAFVMVAAAVDYFLDANYMYLSVKPKVNNPFLIGDWPYYILGLELATLLHAGLVYLPFYFKNDFHQKGI